MAPNGLIGTARLKEIEDDANRRYEEDAWKSTSWYVVRNPSVLLTDAADALLGIPKGLAENRSVVTVLTEGNRLRGLGAALLLLCLIVWLVDLLAK